MTTGRINQVAILTYTSFVSITLEYNITLRFILGITFHSHSKLLHFSFLIALLSLLLCINDLLSLVMIHGHSTPVGLSIFSCLFKHTLVQTHIHYNYSQHISWISSYVNTNLTTSYRTTPIDTLLS